MKKSDFSFDLPDNLIAQTPIEPRDCSRLLVLEKETGKTSHKHFYDVIDYFSSGDVIVLNNSKVLPARIFGIKPITGAKIECLLLKEIKKDIWEVLLKPAKKLKIGDSLIFGDNLLKGEVLEVIEDGKRLMKFTYEDSFFDSLDKIGQMPLPPYITEKLENQSRYQTVYAKDVGSSAAPTAGLHMTDELLEKLKEKGVKVCYVTLHVGLGTFRPVKEEELDNHIMHTEHFRIGEETANIVNEAKVNGKKVFAVGTTSCRVLESLGQKYGKVIATEEDTSIFIHPPYEFKVIDALITNFHLSESSLIMLVSAFAGYDTTMGAYKLAIENEYRFFSFGDAMLIV